MAKVSIEMSAVPISVSSGNAQIEAALQILDENNWTNRRDFLDPWGPQGLTLIHLVAFRGNFETLQRDDDLHVDLYAKDKLGRCALHYAAGQGQVETARWLLERCATDEEPKSPHRFDTRDKDGRTPLHAAIYGGHEKCARMLIKEGLSLASVTKARVTAMDAVFEHVSNPVAFLTDILDEKVSATDNSGNKVILDFRVLTEPPSPQSSEEKPDNISDLHVVIALINAIPNMEQMEILQHPLLAIFLQKKYLPAIPLNVLHLLLHFCVVVCLSCHAVCIKSMNEWCMIVTSIVILSASLISCLFDFLRFPGKRAGINLYLKQNKLSTYMAPVVSILITAFSIALLKYAPAYRTSYCNYFPVMLHPIAIMILLSWTNIMRVLSRFPVLGDYVFMFFAVLLNVGKVLLTFASLILGFALSFSVLFSGIEQFSTPWRAFAKTLVMLTGEYDYNDLFPSTDADNSTVNNSTCTQSNDTSLPVTSTIVILIFVMVTSIGLMNLMVGLAVNDIQELLKEGRSRRLIKQAESAIHWIEPGCIISWLLRKPGHLTMMTSRVIELDLQKTSWIPWRGIPSDVKKALYVLARNSYRDKDSGSARPRTDSPNCDNREESLAAVQSSLQRIIVEQQLQNTQIQRLIQDRNVERQRRTV